MKNNIGYEKITFFAQVYSIAHGLAPDTMAYGDSIAIPLRRKGAWRYHHVPLLRCVACFFTVYYSVWIAMVFKISRVLSPVRSTHVRDFMLPYTARPSHTFCHRRGLRRRESLAQKLRLKYLCAKL